MELMDDEDTQRAEGDRDVPAGEHRPEDVRNQQPRDPLGGDRQRKQPATIRLEDDERARQSDR